MSAESGGQEGPEEYVIYDINIDGTLLGHDWDKLIAEHSMAIQAHLGAMRGVAADGSLGAEEIIERQIRAAEALSQSIRLGIGAATLAKYARERAAELFDIE